MATHTLKAIPQTVREDATSLLILYGPPNRTVSWTLTGNGTLTAITEYTDELGRAYAKYTPGTAGDTPTVNAEYGN